MLFYHPDCDLRFSEFGIEIPIVDDRASTVFNSLKSIFPNLKYTELNQIEKISKTDLLRVHSTLFVEKLFGSKEDLQDEVYKCYELIGSQGEYVRYNPNNQKKEFNHLLATIMLQASMTYASTLHALVNGFSYYLGGGMHHAMSFGGRGFCLINDIVITLRKMQAKGLIKTAWIVDVDVHKGDGAPEILQNDQSIRTLSIHMKHGWPLDSGNELDPWFIPNDVEIGINVREEKDYLAKLKNGLDEMYQRFGKPDLVMVINGSDPYEKDVLPSAGLIKLKKEEMFARDQMLYDFFRQKNIPQSYLMAGGYGEHVWEIYVQFLKFVGESPAMGSEVSSR